MAAKKATKKAGKQGYVVLLTKLAGRSRKPQLWCPADWFLPTFELDEALGFVAASDRLPTPQEGVALGSGMLAQLQARIDSWEELYPTNTWKYALWIVDGKHIARFPLELRRA